MSKSILQTTKECYLCRLRATRYTGELPNAGLHKHHFMHGTADRRLAEEDGLWAYMCAAKHHEHGPEAPHTNSKVDRELKQIAQREYEKIHGHESWMKRYKKNYL